MICSEICSECLLFLLFLYNQFKNIIIKKNIKSNALHSLAHVEQLEISEIISVLKHIVCLEQ